ncbi:FAD-binding protein [Buttiauxella sp. B2]|uniref:FAD-dependent oxidoreductase n=1 Tax=Buttiauxella sp. B2 TaxID=2587812 RepID=UPI00167A9883|nr:FAD-binding protein [Buttiauxella sp. B2]
MSGYIYVPPTANNYPGLDRGFNQRYTLENDLTETNGEGVYLASSTDDVLNALIDINNNHTPLSGEIRVISGGHCYEDFTFNRRDTSSTSNKTRFVIDLSNMRNIDEVTINGTDYITVEPGASNWLIQQTLHSKYGAALPGGSCYSVCAGGHISGGGYGLLSRLHGLTVDYLAGVEMVIPDRTAGFALRTFDESDSDSLNWASRGGGAGHFGVITKYYFRKDKVPAAPERALFVALPVPWSQFADNTNGAGADNFTRFMQAYYTATSKLPGQAFTLGKFTFMTATTDVMSIVMQVVYGDNSGHSHTIGGVDIDPITTQAGAQEVIRSFWSELDEWIVEPETSQWHKQRFNLIGHPVSAQVALDTVYDLPWIDMTQLLNGSGENQKGKYKSSYMITNFTGNEAASIYEFLTDTQTDNVAPVSADTSQTLIQIDSYGLQINKMDSGHDGNTAVAARNSLLKTQYQTYWKTLEGTTPAQALQIETDIVTWFNLGYNNIHLSATDGASSFPVWGNKYQGCYFNYPDRQLGVNDGYAADPGASYGNFLGIYFGGSVAYQLNEIKAKVDPGNVFSHSQSVLNVSSS